MYLDCSKWSAYGVKQEKKSPVINLLKITFDFDPWNCKWAQKLPCPEYSVAGLPALHHGAGFISITFCVKTQNSSKYRAHIYIMLHPCSFFFPEQLFIAGQRPKRLKKSRNNFWRFSRCLFLLGSNSHCRNSAYDTNHQTVQGKWI